VETPLIESWLPAPDVVIDDDASVAVARERVRAVGASAGLARDLIETMALVASELLTNQLRHARGGCFSALLINRGGVPGIEVVAADRGAGLVDPSGALADGTSSSTGLGAGLGAVFRLADEVDVDVRVGEGTCFRARKLAVSPRFRTEIGVFGRPLPGEAVSGDDALVLRDGDVTALAVADGLGHGPYARIAAQRAVSTLRGSVGRGLDHVMREAERLVQGTRGATMAVVRFDRSATILEHAGVGDVGTRLERARRTTKLAGQAGTIGAGRLMGRSLRVDEEQVTPGDFVIIATDGVTSGADAVLAAGRHPLVVAHELVTHFSRAADDALAVVARLA
jgi:anti-sigma regulatory factor (Ser/Thr protein kinase)